MPTQNTVDITINGTTITVPKLQNLPLGIVRKTRNITDETDRLFTTMELLFPEGSPELEVFDSLVGEEEIASFMEQWTGEKDTAVGEY